MEDSASTSRTGIMADSSLKKTVASGTTGNSLHVLMKEWDKLEGKEPVPRAY